MIQGKEIRIGNYLKDRGGKVLRVDFIEYVENGFDTKFGQKMFVEGEEDYPMTEYSDYAQPIILNEDWLIRFGAEKVNQSDWSLKFGGLKFYCRYNKVWYSSIESLYLSDRLQYVHQLQNLYHSITGFELSVSV